MKTIKEVLETSQAERFIDDTMDLVIQFKDQPDQYAMGVLLSAAGMLAHKNRIPLDQLQASVATAFETSGNVMQRAERAHREAMQRQVFEL